MVPKSLSSTTIEDGHRFSEKIMRKENALSEAGRIG